MHIPGKTSAANTKPALPRTAEQAQAEHQQALERAVAAQEHIIARVKERVTEWCRAQAEEKALAILEDAERYPHPVPDMRAFKAETVALQERLTQAADGDFRLATLWAHTRGAAGLSYSLTPWKERAPRESNALEPAWSLLIQQAGDELDELFAKYGFRQWQGADFMRATRLTGEEFILDETIAAAIRDYEAAAGQLDALHAEFQELEAGEKRRKAKELWDSF